MGTQNLKLTRRHFLKLTAATGVLAGTIGTASVIRQAGAAPKQGDSKINYVRTTCSPNCTGACGMNALVEDGQIKSIIQAADYPEAEYNPRGCLKGLSMTNLIYGPDRLQKPLILTGKPGSGDFKEASWNETLDYTAGRLKEIAEKYGPESIGVVFQVGGTGYVQKGAVSRLATLAGWTMHHAYDQNGDLPMFWPMTFGVQSEEIEPREWHNSRYVMVFGSNILATRIPDAHFLLEARNKGAKIMVFDPNFSPTAAKADEWFSIKPSSDAAVALGLARVLIEETLYDSDFIKTFTDLPLLVRVDNGKRLKADEVKDLTKPSDIPAYREAYVAYNGQFMAVHPEKLDLPSDVVIEGEVDVTLKTGETVKVKPAFQLLKESLSQYTPEEIEKTAGIPKDDLLRIAREMAGTKPLHVIYGAGNYQWYHGDLKGRALALLPVLTGNIGKPGAGISTYAGQYRIRFKVAEWWVPEGKKQNWLPFLYVLHGPTKTMKAKWPKNGIKALIVGWGNPFDQHNMSNKLREMVEKEDLEFVVTTDFQMTTSCQYSHAVLPAVSWYEKTDLVATPVHPYLQLQQPAVDPLYEGKPEFWIVRELAKRLNPDFEKYFYPDLEPNQAAEKVIELLLETGGPEVAGITLEHLRKGPVRLKSEVPGGRQIPFYEQVQHKKPFPPVSLPAKLEQTAQFVKSGRIEFYKDEDLMLQAGEALPVHKPPFEESEYALNPLAKEKYQFCYVTRNAIYRVHSTHSNNVWMNELQEGKPRVWLSPEDSQEKGIKEGDEVEIYNDRGKLTAYAIIDPGVGRKQAVFEQGWWSRYLKGASYNSLTYPFIKPTHELYFVPGMWSPNTAWNECLCDVRKVGDSL
ncbi:molybdopterin-dependent oxidoreductase [Desulfosporosinus hippei]|uniref:Tat (Twin-arginine translocation) pathway signal sequence n=1 Tax=Desulfosporosinus hippei DSM 8344 TaxID=1121419 RepID=A0A1G7YRM4_9FIRM|nr:molybdopterin-dependent oxidoreductase [Desulfosporosinus hippei]SDG99037.1 Tat (twin-arginine translocation) pathway signal sequence [Desulfosporosinus hippei DSM 8344]